jgi:hypothetical protein
MQAAPTSAAKPTLYETRRHSLPETTSRLHVRHKAYKIQQSSQVVHGVPQYQAGGAGRIDRGGACPFLRLRLGMSKVPFWCFVCGSKLTAIPTNVVV